MNRLTHYIIVRRDLPLGVALANVTHAAGESFYLFGRGSSTTRASDSSPNVGGENPSPGSIPQSSNGGHSGEAGETLVRTGPEEPIFDVSKTVAVVLGARNESRLLKLMRKLRETSIRFVEIWESEGIYAGQMMAIGLVPTEKANVGNVLDDLHMIEKLDDANS